MKLLAIRRWVYAIVPEKKIEHVRKIVCVHCVENRLTQTHLSQQHALQGA